MTNVSRKKTAPTPEDQPIATPLTLHTDATNDREEILGQLDKLVRSRSLSTDDEVFTITGMAATIEKISNNLHGIGTEIPKSLQLLWAEEAKKRDEIEDYRHRAFEETIERLQKEQKKLQSLLKKTGGGGKIGAIGSRLLDGSVGISIGITVGVATSFLALFPSQLSLARGADGALLQWLSTPNGALLRRSFASGNKSVAECVSKASAVKKNNPKQKDKVMCLLEIK